jgi:hypothetical protein
MTKGMDLPVWVTVVIARFVGGFAVGLLAGVAVAAAVATNTTAGVGLQQSSALTLTLGVTLIGALVTGTLIVALLPPLSGCDVSFGTAFLAALVGSLITFIGGTLFSSVIVRNPSASMYLPLYGAASPLVSLGLTAAGIAATAWMIQSSTGLGSGRGPRYELYGKARRQSLDDEW